MIKFLFAFLLFISFSAAVDAQTEKGEFWFVYTLAVDGKTALDLDSAFIPNSQLCKDITFINKEGKSVTLKINRYCLTKEKLTFEEIKEMHKNAN